MRLLLDSAIRFGFDLAVKATVVFLATGAVLLLLRRSSAATRHRVGVFGLCAALILPILALALPQVAVPLLPDVRPAARPRGEPARAQGAEAALPGEVSWRQLALAVPEKSLTAPAEDTLSPAPSALPRNPAQAPLVPSRPAPWPGLAILLWTLGSIAVGARLLLGWSRVRTIGRDARPIRDIEWLEERNAAARRLELTRRVEILESDAVPVAMTSGLLRPLLLIGRAARQWAVERRRVVLLHELAHVKRGDWPALILAELAVSVYWFHPAAWWLTRRVRRDAETACDDLVIASGTKPSVYAGHLLGIFRSLASPAHPVAPALAIARPHHFEERLRTILDPRSAHEGESRGQARLAAVALAAAAAVVAVVEPWAPREASASASSSASPSASASACRAASPSASARLSSTDSSPAPARKKACSKKPPEAATVLPAVAPNKPAERTPEAESPVTPEALPEPAETVPAIWTPEVSKPGTADQGFVQASKRKSSKTPRDGDDWYHRGMQLHREEDYEGAIEAFRKAIEDGYNEDAASYNIACGYALLGNADQAFEWLKKAMEEGFDVASYLSHDDDLDSLHSDPRWAQLKKEAREQEGSKYQREARAAATRYQRIVARNPKSGEPFFDVGLDLLRSDRYDLAVQAYQAASDRGYRVGTALYNQACAYALAGDKERAFAALQKSLDAGFDQPDTLARDDDLDNLHSDPRWAPLKKQARELSLPSSHQGWWASSSRRERAKWRRAAEDFERYAAAHPQSGRAWYNLGFASLAGDWPEASAEAFQKALELGYRKATTMYNLACAYARLDQKDAAFDWLYKALDAGFDQTHTIRNDDDLDNLRGDPRYRKAIAIARAKERAEEEE